MRKVPENILTLITPDKVRAFLRGRGFSERASKQAGWFVMTQKSNAFVVPGDPKLLGYPDVISSIVESFTTKDITYDEVLYQIFEPNCEILTHRLADDQSTWGTASLGSVMSVVEGYYGVLKENAKYVARGILAGNASDRGKAYTNTCRLGQTDYGSFILRFILPSGMPISSTPEEPMTFGYQVSSLLEDTFAFISRDACTEVEAQQCKPPSLTRKVIEHIAKIAPPASLGAECEVLVRHADIIMSRRPQTSPSRVTRMDSMYFDRVELLRQQYARQDSFQRETYKCYITDLHKDSPAEPPSPQDHTSGQWTPPPMEHKITVELRTGTSRRKLRLILLPVEYREAVRWHDEEMALRIDATIDKRTSNWSVSELHEFRPYADEPPKLFQSPRH